MVNPISTSATILGLLNSTLTLLKGTKELAKDSGNTELKKKLGDLQDCFLELKDKIIDLTDENAGLRAKLEQRESVKRSGEFGYYHKNEDESDPLCPTCYEQDSKLIYLPKPIPFGGGIKRVCRVCNGDFWEKPQETQAPAVLVSRSSWMDGYTK